MIIFIILCLVYVAVCSTQISGNAFERRVWLLTNQERAKQKLEPLQYDDGLADLARVHSHNMAKYNFFAHKDLYNDMVGDRLTKYYPRLIAIAIGENIALHIRPDRIYSPEDVVNDWMNSPPHKENILNREFTHLGVGISIEGNSLYSTQNFATPLARLKGHVKNGYSLSQTHCLAFSYLSVKPKAYFTCLLRFPDPSFKIRTNPYQYSVGCKPIPIKWESVDTFVLAISFPAGKGVYEIQFGFDDLYYNNGLLVSAN